MNAENRYPVAILAGGMATRLGSLAVATPKSLVSVAGRPFVHHQLSTLAESGFTEVVMCVGHLADQIMDTVGTGAEFGLRVSYSHDPPDAKGTATALRVALPLLGSKFYVTYGDSYLRFNYGRFVEAFESLPDHLIGLMSMYRNSDRFLPSNAVVNEGLVTGYGKYGELVGAEWVDYGFLGLRAGAISGSNESDLSALLRQLVADSAIGAQEIDQRERFFEIGTPESLSELEHHLKGPTSHEQ